MIAKVMGAFLLAAGGGYFCVDRIVQRRREIRLLYELAAAMESMEGIIRWEKVTLPVAIERQCNRELCGGFFLETMELMKSKMTLQCAWEKSFAMVKLAKDILCRMEFSGDEEHLTGQLRLSAQRLRQRAEQYSAGRSESEKLRVAICVSVVGLITILLL